MASKYTQEQESRASGAVDGMVRSAARRRDGSVHILQAFAIAATGVASGFLLVPGATDEDKVRAVFDALCIVQAVYDEGKQETH